MTYCTAAEFKNAQKEKMLDLKHALLNRIEWRLKNFERKNLRKEKRQAYDYLKIRLEQSHSWEFENFHEDTQKLQLLNWFLKNNLNIENMVVHEFETIDDKCTDGAIKKMVEPVTNKVEAKRLYSHSLALLKDIFIDYSCDQICLKNLLGEKKK